MPPTAELNERQRAALSAACETFHPRLSPRADDDPVLFASSAHTAGVTELAQQAITLLAPVDRAQVLRLLDLLGGRLISAVAIRSLTDFPKLAPADRERLMMALRDSRSAQLRTAFQLLKRLSSFLFYAASPAAGDNPTWRAIGYEPSRQSPAAGEALVLTTIEKPRTLECDACVVGSGAGGGVVAAALAARGLSVIVLEAGPGDQGPDFTQRELEGNQRLYLEHGFAATRDLGISILAGACLGGGTTVNWQTSLRTPGFIRDEWDGLAGTSVFSSKRFDDALDAVGARSFVSTDESRVNANNDVIRRGCAALDYQSAPIARNSRGCDASQCGYCVFGCRVGGKQSTARTFLQDAQRTGQTTIVASCRADRVMMANGRAIGVEATYATSTGERVPVTVRAPRVIACAGGIQTPALLQRSSIALPHIGRNLFLHPTSAVAGLFPERVTMWSGPPQTILSDQFARLDGNFGFRMEAPPGHPGLMAAAIPWLNARDHRSLMQRIGNAAAIIVLTRDATGGRVRARRDGGVSIDYRLGSAERMLLRRGITEAVRVQLAAGADEVFTLHARGARIRRSAIVSAAVLDDFCARVMRMPIEGNRSSLFSAHQMSTCRVGASPRDGVCDEQGAVFGVKGLYVADASAFPASSGVNPMITVMALAHCVAAAIS